MNVTRIATLFLAAALPVAAQVTISVRLIEVPVTVVDRDGNPVRGLTAANFEVLDDGQPQKITAFEAIDFAQRQSVSAIAPLNPNARRSFLLLFDLGYSDIRALDRARDAARAFVKNSLQPRDLVAVGSIDPEKGFRLLTAFTTDRKLIASAIAEPERYRGNDPLQLSDVDAFGQESSSETVSIGQSDRAAEADAHLVDIKEMTARNNRDYMAGRVMKEIQGLGLLARTLRSVPGRKQVVLLSAGFDPSIVRGRSASARADARDMERATRGQAYLIDNDARFGNTASQNVLDEMVKLFKQSDTVMNAIDIGGLRLTADAAIKGGTGNDGLHLLADPTGGRVFENSNSLTGNLDRMLRQQEVVYVLAFHAIASNKPGRLHNLSVRILNVPGATAQHRVAYNESGGETPIQRTLTNAEVIVNDIAQNDIKVAALASAVPAGARAAVPLFLEINGEDLMRGATAAVPADIFVYAFDDGGIVRDRIHQRINLDPAKASERVKQNGIKYFTTLSLPPGKYAIKSLVVVPELDRRGFVRTDLVVPGAAEMSVLPPLFRDKADQWALLKGVQHDTATAYPFFIDGETFVPSAMPRLRKAERGEFALFLYNASAEEMMMQATVTDAAGVTRPAQPSLVKQVRGENVTKLVFRYDPSAVATGPATLDLLIHKKGSPDIRKASVPLVVTN